MELTIYRVCMVIGGFPAAGEFLEAKCHAAPVSRLRVLWDESLLVSAGEDGAVFVWDVREKDARAAARREQEKLDYAVEVLVTRWVAGLTSLLRRRPHLQADTCIRPVVH